GPAGESTDGFGDGAARATGALGYRFMRNVRDGAGERRPRFWSLKRLKNPLFTGISSASITIDQPDYARVRASSASRWDSRSSRQDTCSSTSISRSSASTWDTRASARASGAIGGTACSLVGSSSLVLLLLPLP